MPKLFHVFIRFLLSGGVNFALTYVIYLASLFFFTYKISYSIAYLSGIIISYFINRVFVFKAHRSSKQIILFPFIYFFQYLLGLVLGIVWVEFFSFSEHWLPLFTTVMCIPPTFILMHLLFREKNKN